MNPSSGEIILDTRVEESIIIPMNPRGDYSGGSTPGSIIAQQWFAKRKGKVIISFDRGCKYVNSLKKPRLGFFYDSRRRKVSHRFSIVDIVDDLGVDKYTAKFLPPWRQELYATKLDPGEHRTWIVISDIFELGKATKLEYFGARAARSFVYTSVGSELTYSKEIPSPEDFIDDIISRSARAPAQFTEDDLEMIIWALMVKNNAEYIRRQRKVEGENLRLDLLTKTSNGEYVVMELKRDTATKETLDIQLRPYMNGVKKDLELRKLKGIIIARDASSDLRKELSKPENRRDIKFVPYRFAFKLGRNEDQLF